MHSQNIALGPFLAFIKEVADQELDIMLEVKDKNLSAVKCHNLVRTDLRREHLTEEWARYKYLTLEHNPRIYQDIRGLLREHAPSPIAFYSRLEEALASTLTAGHVRNAAQHVWGYMDDLATAGENKKILAGLAGLSDPVAQNKLSSLKKAMFKIVLRNNLHYLENNLYFYC